MKKITSRKPISKMVSPIMETTKEEIKDHSLRPKKNNNNLQTYTLLSYFGNVKV